MIVGLVLVVVIALLIVRARRKRVANRTDALLVSREDRTASFARSPGRWLHQRGHL